LKIIMNFLKQYNKMKEIKTQEQIIVENILSKMLYYNNVPYKSLGSVLNMLYAYNFLQYDTCQVGNNQVTVHGNIIATFVFDDNLKLPVFTFNDYDPEHLSYYQNIYLDYINKLNS